MCTDRRNSRCHLGKACVNFALFVLCQSCIVCTLSIIQCALTECMVQMRRDTTSILSNLVGAVAGDAAPLRVYDAAWVVSRIGQTVPYPNKLNTLGECSNTWGERLLLGERLFLHFGRRNPSIKQCEIDVYASSIRARFHPYVHALIHPCTRTLS